MTPRVLLVDPQSPGAGIAEAARSLRAGCLVVFPTETVYGVGAHPAIASALNLLFEAKNRDRRKPIPLLAAGLDEAERAGARFDGHERRVAARFWPGPLTLLVATADGAEEGVRVPDHNIALALLRAAGGTLRATSANQSGRPEARTADDALAALAPFVDVVLDGGPASRGIASTVARARGGKVEVLREGEITKQQIVECLEH